MQRVVQLSHPPLVNRGQHRYEHQKLDLPQTAVRARASCYVNVIRWNALCFVFTRFRSSGLSSTDLPAVCPVYFSRVNPRLWMWSRAAVRWWTAAAVVCLTFASLSSWMVAHSSVQYARRYPLNALYARVELALSVPQLSSLHLIRGAASPCSKKKQHVCLKHAPVRDSIGQRIRSGGLHALIGFPAC